jgi:hypothetical protein
LAVPSGTTGVTGNQINFGASWFNQATAGATGGKSGTMAATATAGQPNVLYTLAVASIDNIAPTITSPSTFNLIEEDSFNTLLTSTESGTWTIRSGAGYGADSSKFGLSGGNNLYMLPKLYLSPTDADGNNVYDVTVRITDAAGNWSEQTNRVTVQQAPLIRWLGALTGTTSVGLAGIAHKAGDMWLFGAFRDGNNAPPTLPTGVGLTDLYGATGVNSSSMRAAGKIATTTSESSGTFTGATSLIADLYRMRPGCTLAWGDVQGATGNSTTITVPALTLQDADGTSWGVVFAGHRSVNTTLETAPTGLTFRATSVDATDEMASYDTDGGVTSFSSVNRAVGGTVSGWNVVAIELKVIEPGGGYVNTSATIAAGATVTATSQKIATTATTIASAATVTPVSQKVVTAFGTIAGLAVVTPVSQKVATTAGAAAGQAAVNAVSAAVVVASANLTGSAAVVGVSRLIATTSAAIAAGATVSAVSGEGPVIVYVDTAGVIIAGASLTGVSQKIATTATTIAGASLLTGGSAIVRNTSAAIAGSSDALFDTRIVQTAFANLTSGATVTAASAKIASASATVAGLTTVNARAGAVAETTGYLFGYSTFSAVTGKSSVTPSALRAMTATPEDRRLSATPETRALSATPESRAMTATPETRALSATPEDRRLSATTENRSLTASNV